MKFYACFVVFEDLSPSNFVLTPFASFLLLHNAFYLIILINSLIFSINCNRYVLFSFISMFFIEYQKLIFSMV